MPSTFSRASPLSAVRSGRMRIGEMKTIGALFETPVQEEVWSRTSSPNSSGRRVRSV